MKTKLSECSLFIAAMCLAAGVEAADVTVDFAAVTGKVKPVHAVGQGPLLGKTNYSLFRHLKEANIPENDKLVSYNDYTIKGGMAGLRYLVENNKDMTAVFVSNYELTMGVVIEASELNLNIPEQLSVIGFDNVEFARACVPKLCIVSQPTKEIAEKLAEVMMERLECTGKREKKIIKLSTGFVEGKSIIRR